MKNNEYLPKIIGTMSFSDGRQLLRAYIDYKDGQVIYRSVDTDKSVYAETMKDFSPTGEYKFGPQRFELFTENNINPVDDLDVEYDGLYPTVNFAWELWLDVDKYFGTSTPEGCWINFYTFWNPYDGLTAELVINSDYSTFCHKWELTKEEKVLLMKKMEQHCKELTGNRLYDEYVQCLAGKGE